MRSYGWMAHTCRYTIVLSDILPSAHLCHVLACYMRDQYPVTRTDLTAFELACLPLRTGPRLVIYHSKPSAVELQLLRALYFYSSSRHRGCSMLPNTGPVTLPAVPRMA